MPLGRRPIRRKVPQGLVESRLATAVEWLGAALEYEQAVREECEATWPHAEQGGPVLLRSRMLLHALTNIRKDMADILAEAHALDRTLVEAQCMASGKHRPGTDGTPCVLCAAYTFGDVYDLVEARLDTEGPAIPASLTPKPAGGWEPGPTAYFVKWLVSTGRLNEGLPTAGR